MALVVCQWYFHETTQVNCIIKQNPLYSARNKAEFAVFCLIHSLEVFFSNSLKTVLKRFCDKIWTSSIQNEHFSWIHFELKICEIHINTCIVCYKTLNIYILCFELNICEIHINTCILCYKTLNIYILCLCCSDWQLYCVHPFEHIDRWISFDIFGCMWEARNVH